MPKNSRQEIARQRAAASLHETMEEDEGESEEEEDTSSRKGARRGVHSDEVITKKSRLESSTTTLFASPLPAQTSSITAIGGSSGKSSSSSKVDKQLDNVVDSWEDALEVNFSKVHIYPKCKVSLEIIIETQLLLRDLMIGVDGANFVLRTLNGLKRYHYTLEYERFSIIINNKDIKLDKHIYIYIHYCLYLLSEDGLEGTQLLNKARTHLTTEGYFVEGPAVLSKNIVYAFEYKKEFYKYLVRIADSYYTKIFKKCKRVMSEVIKLFDFVVPDCGFISREVKFYFQLLFFLTSYFSILFYVF